MRERFLRFMTGRNGSDLYSRFLAYAAIPFIVLSIVAHGAAKTVFWALGLALLLYAYYRIFSRNIYRRREENAKYCAMRSRAVNGFRDWRDRCRQRKDYRFFRCPSCTAMLRVPRGKGRIRVTCRRCGTSFEKKT